MKPQANRRLLLFLVAVLFCSGIVAGSRDSSLVEELRREAESSSHLLEVVLYLTDSIGPRLTGSPALARAGRWTRDQMKEWGFDSVRLEPWGEFGMGWGVKNFRIEMTEPYYFPLIGWPRAWTRSLSRRIEGRPVLMSLDDLDEQSDLQAALSNRIVVLGPRGDSSFEADQELQRLSREELMRLEQPLTEDARQERRERRKKWRELMAARDLLFERFEEEGVALVIESSWGPAGTVFVGGSGRDGGRSLGIPSVVLAAPHFNQVYRMLERGEEIRLGVEMENTIYEGDLQQYNVIGEVRGEDPLLTGEVVMAGAHLDSWHAGTGASDNAVGCAVVMEAVRLLLALDLDLRRTIRVALWSGEEQGLLGSKAYVREHFGAAESGLTEDQERISAYYNLDNGGGRIRGVYLQGNEEVKPMFEDFIRPLQEWGVDTLTLRGTYGTDHLPFDRVGIPAFQFIQDPLLYDSLTHHSNMDLFDYVSLEDLKQASIVLAWFLYRTANQEERLPRKSNARKTDEGRRGD